MNKLSLLVLSGLGIRLALAFIPGFKIDMDVWAAWAMRVYDLGFPNFYSTQIWTNYTPGYIYILFFLGGIQRIFSLPPEIFYYLLKIPPILAELTLTTLVFKILKEKATRKLTYLAAGLIVFNPAFIFNSSVWGQIDGLLTLFMILSIYLLNRNQFILSSMTFTIALLIKPQALFLLPLYILFILKNFNWESIVKLTIPGILLSLAVSLPFFLNKPITGLLELIIEMSNDYSATSLFAYNFWGIIGFWIDDSNIWYILSYRHWGLILLSIYWISLTVLYLRKKINLYALAALSLLSFYFLPTRVHERYLYPTIPFLIILAVTMKSKMILAIVSLISIIHFLNLYFVYVYYNEIYLNLPKILYQEQFYNLLKQNGKALSTTSTLLFLALSYIILKSKYVKESI